MSRCWGLFHHRVNYESSSGFTPREMISAGFSAEAGVLIQAIAMVESVCKMTLAKCTCRERRTFSTKIEPAVNTLRVQGEEWR
ncbi:hypothetical protein TNCV_4614481 [Trichonephila clavipes]|nr:hypothetical protein TNCV_4614481 [Trichonephila clavipes]